MTRFHTLCLSVVEEMCRVADVLRSRAASYAFLPASLLSFAAPVASAWAPYAASSSSSSSSHCRADRNLHLTHENCRHYKVTPPSLPAPLVVVCQCRLSGAGSGALADLMHTMTTSGGCHELELSRSRLGASKLRTLAPSIVASAATLRSVEAKHCMLGDDGIQEFLSFAGNLTVLAELELATNGITDTGAAALAAALHTMPALGDLDLGANLVNAQGASQLVLAAKTHSHLYEMDLAFNAINDSIVPAVQELFDAPHTVSLRKLKLSGNFLSPTAVAQLAAVEAAAQAAGVFVKIKTGNQRLLDRAPAPVVPVPVAPVTPQAAPLGGVAAAPKLDVEPNAPPVATQLDVADWSDADVHAWLTSLSPALSGYADAFAAAAINGEMLASLDGSDLEVLGVTNKFHRARILQELKKMLRRD